jgi:hypothetical protein
MRRFRDEMVGKTAAMSRTAARAVVALLATALSLTTTVAHAEPAKGKHFATVLSTHGLKEQACIDAAGVAYFRGDGRHAKKNLFALVTITFTQAGAETGRIGTSVNAGKPIPQGGQTAQGDLVTIKAKVYNRNSPKVLDRAKAKVAVTALAAC